MPRQIMISFVDSIDGNTWTTMTVWLRSPFCSSNNHKDFLLYQWLLVIFLDIENFYIHQHVYLFYGYF